MRSLLLFFVFAVLWSGRLFADADTPALDENYYPYSASLVVDLEAEGGRPALPAGTPFVLIRVEPGDVAVADVSRRGVYRVPMAATDIARLTRAAMRADADKVPEMSRMAAFIGNKLVSGASGWQDRLPMSVALKYHTWVFLYADATAPATADAVRAAETFYASLDERARAGIGLVFMEVKGDKAGIQAVAETHRPGFHAMPGYLSIGYTRSFAHLDDARAAPAFVAVNAAGTVLARLAGADVPDAFWARCRAP